MTRIIPELGQIAASYDTLFCDLWGCVHNGHDPYPAAVAALQSYRRGGGKVVLMTNAPRPGGDVIVTLDRMGLPRDAWDIVVSSGDAAQFALFEGAVGRRVWHLGPDKDEGFFTNPPEDHRASDITRVPLAEAEGIVCTGPFHEMTETPEDYRGQLLLAKVNGLKMLCTNPDIEVDLGDHRIYCAGAIAELYTQMGGEALYFGKPHPPIYDLARRRLSVLGHEVDPARTLAIGDGIATDIMGGIAEGIDTLFVTGGLAAAHFGPGTGQPDPALLDPWLAARQLSPTFAIGRLR